MNLEPIKARDGITLRSSPAKYSVRLKGGGMSCQFLGCEQTVTGCLIDDEIDRAVTCCDNHIKPDIAAEEGLRVVRFA